MRRELLLLLLLLLLSILFLLLFPSFAEEEDHRENDRRLSFGRVTRRKLLECRDAKPMLSMTLDTQGPLQDVQTVRVTVSGVDRPSDGDWIGVFSAASHNYSDCPSRKALYVETGDTAELPLLCDYPVKFRFLKEDAAYLPCRSFNCSDAFCLSRSCSASIAFRIINIRTDITFVLFSGGLSVPCIRKISKPLSFAKPFAPLYGHVSSRNSLGTSIMVTWVSGSSATQYVEYGWKKAASSITTFTKDDMCGVVPAAAKDFGWHSPGYIHSATMNGLLPSFSYSYRYGSDGVGWSAMQKLSTPPASGSSKLKFAVYGDMGKSERDNSGEHYVQPGSLQVIDALKRESVDAVFHIGDISYATGFLAEWDVFLEMISPVASKVPYMTSIGNHERDFPGSGSKYATPDSGGECGVPYEKYFPMPVSAQDKPWYAIEMGPVHFTVISTEHDWSPESEQHNWIKQDLKSVDRSRTPWLVFAGHRPMYSSQDTSGIVSKILPGVDPKFAPAVEPLLKDNKVDLVLWGHVHNYERTCAVYKGNCTQLPARKNSPSRDTYQVFSNGTSSPVHVVVGMAGFKLDGFPNTVKPWSLIRISSFGYARVTADRRELLFEFVPTQSGAASDSFRMIRQAMFA